MGRCPVRSIFPEALALLEKKQHLFGWATIPAVLVFLQNNLIRDGSFMFENIMPLQEAVQGYTLFDEMKVQKIVFKP